MASRTSRYEPRHDDDTAYPVRNSFPDPHISLNDDAYEYVGPESFPEPPAHTFDREEEAPRRRSPSRNHRSNRASTQPPKTSTHSPPPRMRRAASPPAHSSRYSDSPRRSRRAASPPPLSSKPVAAAKPSRQDRFSKRPAVQNMKVYGRKGLSTLGDVVEAYAAAQASPLDGRGRPRGRDYPYDNAYYPPSARDRYADPYEQPRRRRRGYSPSPSPSPPRRSLDRRTTRKRPPLNGRHKSYSVSPAPLSRDPDHDRDRGRRHGRRSRQPSVSSSESSVSPPPRRRAKSHSHGRDSSPGTEKLSRRRLSMNAAKEHMASPNPEIARRWQLAARAALEAGGVTAFRLRKEPGSWAGAKGAKVATAALGAAAIDAFIDKDPRRSKQGGMKGVAENVIGGMIASKVMGFKSATTRKGTYRY